MTYRHFKHESLLYALAFLLAFTLRFTALGATPLVDTEAEPALQALRLSQGASPTLAPHPFYSLFTSVLFFLYGSGTNFLARLLPALAGSLLVLTPLLFTNRLKPRPSLILAFFLALDPGLVALSRQAASPIFAITFTVLTLGALNKQRHAPAAVFAALALLSGPSIWFGMLVLSIAWMILQGFKFGTLPEPFRPTRSDLLPFLLTFFMAGTLALSVPNGLSAAFAALPAFLSKWSGVSEVTAGQLTLSLLIYQPLALLLAILAIIRGWRYGSRRIIILSTGMLVALLIAVFLPARQMQDLVWALLPLHALAALELARAFDIFPEERREVAGVSGLTGFIWLFAWLGFSGMVWLAPDTNEYILRLWMLAATLVLLAISLLLIAAGWSIRIAKFGGIWGMVMALGTLALAGTVGVTGLRGTASPEFWWLPNTPAQADLLQASVRELSEWSTGDDFSAEVVIVGVDIPSLEWALREHPVQVVSTLDVTRSPHMVITSLETNPALVAAYRGQDFSWRQTPIWNTNTLHTWVRWLTLRQMPQSGETLILWARDDLFLGK